MSSKNQNRREGKNTLKQAKELEYTEVRKHISQ